MLNIRLATKDDIKNIFDLSNDNEVRKNSIHQEKIEWNEHVKWFEEKLNNVNTIFYVAYDGEFFVGYCRLDKNNNEEWIVTIHINPKFRLKGYGKKLLNYVCDKNNNKNIVAFVKVSNIPSCKTFLNSNFINIKGLKINNVKYLKFAYLSSNYVIAISNNLYDDTDLCKKNNFIYINNKNDLTYENLIKINPKYVFFPHWSYIIKPEIFENFNCVIFHMTDLPFGRGGSPLQNLIERGIYHTKISAIKCVKELDAGDVYLKEDFDISYGSAQEIYIRASEIVSNMIDKIVETNPIPHAQQGEIVEFKRRKPQQSNIENINNINKIYDYIRMLDADGYPKAYLERNNIKYEFYNAKLENGKIIANVEIKVKDE